MLGLAAFKGVVFCLFAGIFECAEKSGKGPNLVVSQMQCLSMSCFGEDDYYGQSRNSTVDEDQERRLTPLWESCSSCGSCSSSNPKERLLPKSSALVDASGGLELEQAVVLEIASQKENHGLVDFGSILLKNPTSVCAAHESAKELERQGAFHQAVQGYKRALGLSRNLHLPSWKALGQLYACQTPADYASAAICFKHVSHLEPHNAENFLLLGMSLITLGKAKEALRQYHQGLRQQPIEPKVELELLFSIALILEDTHSPLGEIVNSYRKVISRSAALVNHDAATSQRVCAQAQMALGGLMLARQQYNKALEWYALIDLALPCLDEETAFGVQQSIEFCRRELEARRL